MNNDEYTDKYTVCSIQYTGDDDGYTDEYAVYRENYDERKFWGKVREDADFIKPLISFETNSI